MAKYALVIGVNTYADPAVRSLSPYPFDEFDGRQHRGADGGRVVR